MGNCAAGTESSVHALRVLVLGIASSGKSTFSKQMKILHCQGFSDDELINYKNILIQNLFLGFKDLLIKVEEMEHSVNKKNKKAASFFSNSNPYDTPLSKEVIEKATALWGDDGIKHAIAEMGKFEFTESLQYVMKNLERIAGEEWRPSNEDVLHVRQRTTGIVETRFKVEKYNWTLVDVGGQKVERRKWIHSQTNLNALIYFVALDEYDIKSDDEPGKTKLEESIAIYEETINAGTLANVPIILFLNKEDLFAEKIKTVPIKKTYKTYKGGKDFKAGCEFIRDKFLSTMTDDAPCGPEEVYVHVACAIDTENIRRVFASMKDFIFRQRLKISGL